MRHISINFSIVDGCLWTPWITFPSSTSYRYCVCAFFSSCWRVSVSVTGLGGFRLYFCNIRLLFISGLTTHFPVKSLNLFNTAWSLSSSDFHRYPINDTCSLSHCCFTEFSPLPPICLSRYSLSTEAHLWWLLLSRNIPLVFMSSTSNIEFGQLATVK